MHWTVAWWSPVVLAAGLLMSGCAGAQILSVTAPTPTECGKLVVECEVNNLYPHECMVVAQWAGYQAQARVPLEGGPQPEYATVELKDWTFLGAGAGSLAHMEVRFDFRGKRIARRRMTPPFATPEVLTQPCPDESSAATTTPTAAARPAPAPVRSAGQPQGWPTPKEYSASLDAPTRKPLSGEIVCELSADSGPRYIALEQTPDGVVQLVIDVQSKGEARFREVTFWSVELLDAEGQLMPHAEEGRVDLGGHRRLTAEWRFDGSPVILKLQSFSQDGDWMRIRFE